MAKKVKRIGGDANRSLSKYLEEIGQYEPLAPKNEIALAQRVKQGDRIALKKLTEANLRFVVSVAKDYQGQGLPLTDLINEGKTPVIEKDIGEMIKSTVSSGLLRATQDVRQAVFDSEISLICVGTPSQLTGSLDLIYVRKVCEEIGATLHDKSDYHLVVVRTPIIPISMRAVGS